MGKIIKFEEIDHQKETISGAIGITPKEFSEYAKRIESTRTPAESIKKLGISIAEIAKVFSGGFYKATEAVVVLWKGKGKTEVSVEVFIETAILLQSCTPFSAENIFIPIPIMPPRNIPN